ncbi:MAG: DUF2255 family protein [Acidobacteriaceae bacterium]|nr:DUF2255 family protein [Acidobacteriaceae bacterium]
MWQKEEFDKTAATDDLHITAYRKDARTLGTPTWIWSVRVDDNLYVRAYNSQSSSWYQACQQKAGQIKAAGLVKDVTLELVPESTNRKLMQLIRRKTAAMPILLL